MKKQAKFITIRRALLYISLLLFPITQWYLSPVLSYEAGIEGVINASMIVFVSFLILGAFFGKAFCAWIMPCGGLQETCYNVNNKTIKTGKKDKIKYLIWVPWILGIIYFLLSNYKILHFDLLFKMRTGISIDATWKFIIYYIVISIFVILSFIFGKRASCKYICWITPFMIIGRKVGNFLRVPALRIKANPVTCVSCKLCDKSCGMGLNVNEMVKNGKFEHSECMLCGECINVCSKKSIKFVVSNKIT